MPDKTSHSQALPSGYRLGDYIIERILGQGGFSLTYLARDIDKNTPVIIKENLPAGIACRDATTRQVMPFNATRQGRETFDWALGNFYNEAQLLASLNHPNIVKVTRAFQALGTAFYVMPQVGGKPIDECVEEYGAPDAGSLLRIMLSLLSALEYLHQRDLLHRDIKPQNILLANGGEPVLIDFGAARYIISERTATKVESPGYTPFEQTQSHGRIGPWTDLYALGATLYHLITGRCPVDCNDRVMETVDPLKPLGKDSSLVKIYGKGLLSTIDKALEIVPGKRWQSAAKWRAALEALPPVKQAKKRPKPVAPAKKTDPSAKHNKKMLWFAAGGAALLLASISLTVVCMHNSAQERLKEAEAEWAMRSAAQHGKEYATAQIVDNSRDAGQSEDTVGENAPDIAETTPEPPQEETPAAPAADPGKAELAASQVRGYLRSLCTGLNGHSPIPYIHFPAKMNGKDMAVPDDFLNVNGTYYTKWMDRHYSCRDVEVTYLGEGNYRARTMVDSRLINRAGQCLEFVSEYTFELHDYEEAGLLITLIAENILERRELPDVETPYSELVKILDRLKQQNFKKKEEKEYQQHLTRQLSLIIKGYKVDVTTSESAGNTPLHYAVLLGDQELVEWLLKHGANPNAKAKNGALPIQRCKAKSNTAIYNLLIKHGARKK